MNSTTKQFWKERLRNPTAMDAMLFKVAIEIYRIENPNWQNHIN